MPDTFFRNEKVGHFHAILVNNVYVRVFPNGDVLFSIRCRVVKLKWEKDESQIEIGGKSIPWKNRMGEES